MINNCFKVIEQGFLTTIQDLGRFGFASKGVSKSGSSDEYSFKISNLLLDNDIGAAALEVTYGLTKLLALNPIYISITGGNLDPRVNNTIIPMWQTIELNKDDILSFGLPNMGFRSYIAVSGGIRIPLVLDSSSTHVSSKIGGISGRGLNVGDFISSYPRSKNQIMVSFLGEKNEGSQEIILRVIPGPQEDHFSAEILGKFYSSSFKVTDRLDRIGITLKGPALRAINGNHDIISDVTPEGSVQIPGDGQPLILLSDCQTTGGYPKIGVVASVDLPKLGQISPSNTIKFLKINIEEAEHLFKIMNESITYKNLREIVIKKYSIDIIGSKYDVKLYKNTGSITSILDTENISVTVNGKYVDVKMIEDSDDKKVS